MASVSFDDQYPLHRKVGGLSHEAFRLHTEAIFWCDRNMTDGFIPAEDLPLVCPRIRNPERFAAECVRRKCWHEARTPCESEACPAPAEGDGWVIHDYLDHHPSKKEALATRDGKSDGGSLGNHRRWHAGRGVVKPGCEYCRIGTSSHNRSDIRSHDRQGTDRSSESVANPRARADQNQSSRSVVDVVSHVADRYARVIDDDGFVKSIIGLIHQRLGRVITAQQAKEIAEGILAASRSRPSNPQAYVLTSIRNEADPKGRFLPPEPEPPPRDRCGQCNPYGRLENADGSDAGPCPTCNPSAHREPA